MRSSREESRPIVVVRRGRKAEAGHHGGAWKVAYADFVTAMMAFFLVMWIMGMDQEARDMVQGYFNNPLGLSRDVPSGLNPVTVGEFTQVTTGSGVPASGLSAQQAILEAVARSIRIRLMEAGLEGFDAAVELVMTEEGLRIELMEVHAEEVLFERGAASVEEPLRLILAAILPEIQGLPNEVIVEGHTDRTRFISGGAYGNWELSADRANAVRRVLEANGLSEGRIREVRGLADRTLRIVEDPFDPRNRRVSLLLPFLIAEGSEGFGTLPDREESP